MTGECGGSRPHSLPAENAERLFPLAQTGLMLVPTLGGH